MKLSRKIDPTTGASKTILQKKFAKCEFDDVTRNPKQWITKLKLIRGYLEKLDVHIDDSAMMTHII